jgi:glycylpeptide N-tetradecanoyltransferase
MKLTPSLAEESTKAKAGASIAEDHDASAPEDVQAGLARKGKSAKDMASYKFWGTQPVPKFGEEPVAPIQEGPIKIQKLEDVPKQPPALISGFEWDFLDLTDKSQLDEVYDLLSGHFVEDDGATFRLKYSTAILKWAMMSPGWKKQWHRGVRATQSKKLVAFIAANSLKLKVHQNTLHASEVNFMVVHKKLRSKRLAPVLIKEITRLCNLDGVWQAIYTGGNILPKPVSTCRYFHRPLNWQKLWEVGFSYLPSNSTPQYQVRKYAMPSRTAIRGLRKMKAKDVKPVHDLLMRYLKRFDLYQEFDQDEVEHWFVHKKDSGDERAIHTYVVEVRDLSLRTVHAMLTSPLRTRIRRSLTSFPSIP